MIEIDEREFWVIVDMHVDELKENWRSGTRYSYSDYYFKRDWWKLWWKKPAISKRLYSFPDMRRSSYYKREGI